jgi:hypothetical protein
MLAKALEIFAVVLIVIGIAIYTIFRDKTIDEARTMLGMGFVSLVSWPGRYFTYRSGSGKHTPQYVARHAAT